ncbi:hypothetical protein GCM10017687_35920 [Streptomyces echinatus]
MSNASMPPHGFVTVRGRGYRPDQVDAYLEALSDNRDAAWERAARLTVLAKEMEAEAVRVRQAVAELPPQTYETLGGNAGRLFQFVQEEAADLLDRTRREAQRQAAQAEADAERVLQEAREAADAIRAEADERAEQTLLAAQAEARRRPRRRPARDEDGARRGARRRTRGTSVRHRHARRTGPGVRRPLGRGRT